MKGNKALSIIVGILMVIAGFYCIAAPAMADSLLMWIIIGALLVSSISNICSWGSKRKLGEANGWNLAGFIISLFVAIVLMVNFGARLFSLAILMYVIMGWMVVMGFMRIATAFKIKKNEAAGQNWGIVLVMGILMVISGLFGLSRPLGAALAIGMIIGIDFVVCGFNFILGSAEE